MNILIDADGCPVVDLTLQIAKQFGVPIIILCDTAHQIEREGAQTLVFDKGADSVDFALVNRVKPGDIVVTQDYGLASMCLAKRARVLNQNGLEYTADNMEALMLRRYENKKLLRAGKHPKGSPKRTKQHQCSMIGQRGFLTTLNFQFAPSNSGIQTAKLHCRWIRRSAKKHFLPASSPHILQVPVCRRDLPLPVRSSYRSTR